MSEARTIWHAMEARRSAAVSRDRAGLLIAAALLCAMAAAEVLFRHYVAGPDSVNLLMAAEGFQISD
jgi:hypothetical protein